MRRPSYYLTLLAILALLVVWPVLSPTGAVGVGSNLSLLGLLVPVLAVAASSERLRQRLTAITLAALCAIANGELVLKIAAWPPAVGPAAALAFLGYTTYLLITGVARSRAVTGDVIAGALAAYLMIGFTWAMAYGLAEFYRPGSIVLNVGDGAGGMTVPILIYYSFITLMTIGYGDVTPATPAARTLAVLEGLSGVIFTTVILAVLVAAYLQQARDRDQANPPSSPIL
jgi:hypothetical protein